MSFCFGFRRPESGFTLGISMLGVGKAAPAQFPACGREFTRHSARGPEGPLGEQGLMHKISILTVLFPKGLLQNAVFNLNLKIQSSKKLSPIAKPAIGDNF